MKSENKSMEVFKSLRKHSIKEIMNILPNLFNLTQVCRIKNKLTFAYALAESFVHTKYNILTLWNRPIISHSENVFKIRRGNYESEEENIDLDQEIDLNVYFKNPKDKEASWVLENIITNRELLKRDANENSILMSTEFSACGNYFYEIRKEKKYKQILPNEVNPNGTENIQEENKNELPGKFFIDRFCVNPFYSDFKTSKVIFEGDILGTIDKDFREFRIVVSPSLKYMVISIDRGNEERTIGEILPVTFMIIDLSESQNNHFKVVYQVEDKFTIPDYAICENFFPVKFSKSEKFVAFGDSALRLVNLETMTMVKFDIAFPMSISIAEQDDVLIASGFEWNTEENRYEVNNSLFCINPESSSFNTKIFTFNNSTGSTFQICATEISPLGGVALFGNSYKTLQIVNYFYEENKMVAEANEVPIEDNNGTYTSQNHEDELISLSFSPCGNYLAYGSAGGSGGVIEVTKNGTDFTNVCHSMHYDYSPYTEVKFSNGFGFLYVDHESNSKFLV